MFHTRRALPAFCSRAPHQLPISLFALAKLGSPFTDKGGALEALEAIARPAFLEHIRAPNADTRLFGSYLTAFALAGAPPPPEAAAAVVRVLSGAEAPAPALSAVDWAHTLGALRTLYGADSPEVAGPARAFTAQFAAAAAPPPVWDASSAPLLLETLAPSHAFVPALAQALWAHRAAPLAASSATPGPRVLAVAAAALASPGPAQDALVRASGLPDARATFHALSELYLDEIVRDWASRGAWWEADAGYLLEAFAAMGSGLPAALSPALVQRALRRDRRLGNGRSLQRAEQSAAKVGVSMTS